MLSRIIYLAAAAVFLFITTSAQKPNAKPQDINISATTTAQIIQVAHSTSTNAAVIHVVDGDTIDATLDSEPTTKYRIRLLGVNTPETVDPRKTVECFGKQASDFSKSKLSSKRVRLESDPQADERDKYDRLLRNVYLEDGTDFNAMLVEQGYAYAYLSFPLNADRKTQLRKLEAQAKAAGRGLWAAGVCD